MGPNHPESLTTDDHRLDAAALIVGVELGESRRAYPLGALHAEGGIAEDVLGDHPIVVVTRPGSWLALAFAGERETGRVKLRWEDGADDRPPVLVDLVGGGRFTLWGESLSEHPDTASLRYVRSTLKKWGNWAIAHPQPDLWMPATQ